MDYKLLLLVFVICVASSSSYSYQPRPARCPPCNCRQSYRGGSGRAQKYGSGKSKTSSYRRYGQSFFAGHTNGAYTVPPSSQPVAGRPTKRPTTSSRPTHQQNQVQNQNRRQPPRVVNDLFGRRRTHPSSIPRFSKYFDHTGHSHSHEFFQPMGTEGIGHEHGDHGEHSHMFETGDSFENCSNEPNDETGTYLITAADEGCSPMNYNNAISFCTGSGLSAVSLDSSRPASEVGEILDLAGIPGNEKFWTSGLIVRDIVDWAEAKDSMNNVNKGIWANGMPVPTGPHDPGCVAVQDGPEGPKLVTENCQTKLPVVCEPIAI